MTEEANSFAVSPNHADLVLSQGRLMLSGHLNFANAPAILEKSIQLMPQCSSLQFDFSQLQSANSVVIALIVEWMKYAEKHGKSIQLQHLSDKIASIARAAGMKDFLES